MTIPDYTSIIGAGPGISFIRNETGTELSKILILGNQTTISNLSIHLEDTEDGTANIVVSINSSESFSTEDPTTASVIFRNVDIQLTSVNTASSTGVSITDGGIWVDQSVIKVANSDLVSRAISALSGDADILVTNSEIISDKSEAILTQTSGNLRIANTKVVSVNGVKVNTGTGTVYGSYIKATGTCLGSYSNGLLTVFNTILECTTERGENSGGNVVCVDLTDESGNILDADCQF